MGRWEGRMRHRVVYGAKERARKGHGAVWGDGKGAGGMGRCMGRWEGRGRDKVVYGAMGSAREGWGGVWGDGKGA